MAVSALSRHSIEDSVVLFMTRNRKTRFIVAIILLMILKNILK